MIKKIVCPSCGIDFEAISLTQAQALCCPNCASEVDPGRGKNLEELSGYKIFDLLGQGGMGQVFRALAPDGSDVALKVMAQEAADSPDLRERFEREMSIMASLSHPNIVRLLYRGQTPLFKFFVMELVEGTTLRHLIREDKLTGLDFVSISCQTLSALGYAHSHGIVHRDVKPENILFNRERKVKVTDFGLARKLTFEGPALTVTNAFMGTENYMSPEQKINPKAVTHKSDIYSFGVVLYEMLSGGMLPLGIFQPPSFYRQTTECWWDDITFRLLDLNPDMRPENCEEIIREIKNLSENPPAAHISNGGTVPQTADSSETAITREGERIKMKFQEICEVSYALYQKGEYAQALKNWQQALEFSDENDDRANLQNWIKSCKEKIAEQDRNSATVFLCPSCLKPFSQDAKAPIPEKMPCPNCREDIIYDFLRKEWHRKNSLVKKDSFRVEGTPGKEKPQEKQEEGSILRQGILLMIVFLLGVDWWNPDLFDEGIKLAVAKGLTVGISASMTGLIVRFVLYLFVIIWGCNLAYAFYDNQRKPPSPLPVDDNNNICKRK